MTLSLVAFDQLTQSFGTCSITSSPCHGQRCLHFRKGVGIVLSQGKTNRHHGEKGIELLSVGMAPAECIASTQRDDANIQHRQIAIVDRHGQTAAFSGSELKVECGQAESDSCLAVGNYLANAQVLAATIDGFNSASGSFEDRLLAGCRAGQHAGGERGGHHSGFILVTRPDQMQPWGAHIDIRIDFCGDAVAALEDALRAYREWEKDRLEDPLSTLDGSLPISSLHKSHATGVFNEKL